MASFFYEGEEINYVPRPSGGGKILEIADIYAPVVVETNIRCVSSQGNNVLL